MLKVFWFICGGFWSCNFHMPKYLRHGTESLCPMETGQSHFTILLYKAKSLRKFRQMKEMFAVLLHYIPQEIRLFWMWGEFSPKITHFMLMHSKVNCRKIQMNKIGDSYLPCIAMAHSPQVFSGIAFTQHHFHAANNMIPSIRNEGSNLIPSWCVYNHRNWPSISNLVSWIDQTCTTPS
jgi:hypothetical protein